MADYRCRECGTPAIVSLGVVTRLCACDAAVVAEASASMAGAGGVV